MINFDFSPNRTLLEIKLNPHRLNFTITQPDQFRGIALQQGSILRIFKPMLLGQDLKAHPIGQTLHLKFGIFLPAGRGLVEHDA